MKQSSFDKIISLLSEIYVKSKYVKDIDIFRVKDVLDSFSKGQFANKEWAVKELQPYLKDKDACIVIGGWYGLLSYLLKESNFDGTIWNYDLDPVCREYGEQLRIHDKVYFTTEDGLTFVNSKTRNNQNKIVICTACEHIDQEDLNEMLVKKHKDAIVCLQSNNYYEIDSHINCHDSLDHFISELPLREIYYSGTKNWNGEYDRFMVIGR